MEILLSSKYLLLLLGAVILAVVAFCVVLPNVLPTPRGSLNRQRRELRHRRYQLQQAIRAAEGATKRFEKLQRNARNVEPAKLDEAGAKAKDMQILAGHANDKVLVAENHVRRVILDRFPPAKQERMLSKFVPERDERSMPFSF